MTLNVNTLQGHFTQSIVKLADAASHGAGRTGENRSSWCSRAGAEQVSLQFLAEGDDRRHVLDGNEAVPQSRRCHRKRAIAKSWPLCRRNGQHRCRMNAIGDDRQLRLFAAGFQQGMSALCPAGNGKPERRVGIVFTRGLAANVGRGGADWCDSTVAPRKISQAATFRTEWSLSRRRLETPSSNEQQ